MLQGSSDSEEVEEYEPEVESDVEMDTEEEFLQKQAAAQRSRERLAQGESLPLCQARLLSSPPFLASGRVVCCLHPTSHDLACHSHVGVSARRSPLSTKSQRQTWFCVVPA